MLEVGKLYVVKTSHYTWLFKKSAGHYITTCSRCVCLDDTTLFEDYGTVCGDDNIVWIKPASRNYIVVWNRILNDNVNLD